MKFRESGMPNEQLWDTFFSPRQILDKMGINNETINLMDIGCGYGTFLIPASGIVCGRVIGIDIESEMIDACKVKVKDQNIKNIDLLCGDILDKDIMNSLKIYKGKIDYVTLFNILHCEQPLELLKSAYEMLQINGRIGIIHWKYENTPRGPSMGIRPTPENITMWAAEAGLVLEKQLELPPYHYGLVFVKNKS